MYADVAQHFYGDESLNVDKTKLRSVYKDIDNFAGRVKKYFSEDFDTIIFMSDHGLVTETGHNKNAFYSCNRPLFEESPDICDFHDKILDIVS
jgi:predicted AlkP superfamily pyrophosphatase or phosphodiesterase